MAGKPIRPALMEYAQNHAGELMFAHKIAKDLRETIPRVRKGLANALGLPDGIGLERVTTDIWRYTPPGPKIAEPPAPPEVIRQTFVPPPPVVLDTLFRKLTELADGSLIIESDQGEAYRAVKL